MSKIIPTAFLIGIVLTLNVFVSGCFDDDSPGGNGGDGGNGGSNGDHAVIGAEYIGQNAIQDSLVKIISVKDAPSGKDIYAAVKEPEGDYIDWHAYGENPGYRHPISSITTISASSSEQVKTNENNDILWYDIYEDYELRADETFAISKRIIPENADGYTFILENKEGEILLEVEINVTTFEEKEEATPITNTEIEEDEVWTKDNSPYLITSTVTVYSKVTLTIEPGTTIYFQPPKGVNDKVSLMVHGTLIADGTENNMISFLNNMENPLEGWDYWGDITFESHSEERQSIVRYCNIDYAYYGVFASGHSSTTPLIMPKIENNVITNTVVGIYIRGVYTEEPVPVQYNQIDNAGTSGIDVLGGDAVLYKNTIKNSGAWAMHIDGGRNYLIDNNYMSTGAQGILVMGYADCKITNNTIMKFTQALWDNNADALIEYNLIEGNDVGVRIGDGSKAVLQNNSIMNNKEYSLKVEDEYKYGLFSAENNYWGTTDEYEISSMIYGSADFEPWLIEAPV